MQSFLDRNQRYAILVPDLFRALSSQETNNCCCRGFAEVQDELTPDVRVGVFNHCEHLLEVRRNRVPDMLEFRCAKKMRVRMRYGIQSYYLSIKGFEYS